VDHEGWESGRLRWRLVSVLWLFVSEAVDDFECRDSDCE
jgi:hypothetical protein